MLALERRWSEGGTGESLHWYHGMAGYVEGGGRGGGESGGVGGTPINT